MNSFLFATRAESLNAKVGAVALAVAAFLILLLSHFSAPLAPLRLLSLALAAFAAWCLCDEMGLHKPLNRAGLVLFAIAVVAKVQLAVGVAAELAVGVVASLTPLVMLVAAHVVLGTGAMLGAGALLSATEGAAPVDLGFVTAIERIFGLWSYVAAWLLWRGHI